jgi:hypothetical protein
LFIKKNRVDTLKEKGKTLAEEQAKEEIRGRERERERFVFMCSVDGILDFSWC